jgi:predicted dehydrogenase
LAIRTGIIGTGFGAQVHGPVLKRHPEYELVAISSIRPGRAQAAAERLGLSQAYQDWRRMIAEARLDLAVIASEPSLHSEMSLACLEAGLHVLCEKPPALNADQASAMHCAARRAGRIAAINFEWRFSPERQAIKRILDAGKLGALYHVDWAEAWPLRPQKRKARSEWETVSGKGGGMLGAVGSHMIDALQYWFGPMKLYHGFTARESIPGPEGANDSFFVHGIWPDGGSFALQFIASSTIRPARLEIHGSGGTLLLHDKQLTFASSGSSGYKAVPVEQPLDARLFAPEIRGYIHAQWSLYGELARAIRGEEAPALPAFEDGVRVQRVMDTINRPWSEAE